LIAFGRGDYASVTSLLASLPPLAHRIGGSHAQRDLLHLTLLQALEYLGRPISRLGTAAHFFTHDPSIRRVRIGECVE
jgi:hypothetical protein